MKIKAKYAKTIITASHYWIQFMRAPGDGAANNGLVSEECRYTVQQVPRRRRGGARTRSCGPRRRMISATGKKSFGWKRFFSLSPLLGAAWRHYHPSPPAMTVNSVNGALAVGKVGRRQPVWINRVCLRAAPWPPPAGHQSVLRRPLAAQSPFYGACEMIKHLLMTATHIWTDRTFSARNPGGIAVMVPARRGATVATCDVQQANKDLRLRLSGRSCGGSWVSDTIYIFMVIIYTVLFKFYCLKMH